MRFSDIIEQAKALLQRQGRITYRSLKREFDLEDEALEDLKFELIDGQELAVDKDGKMLVWIGERSVVSSQSSVPSPQPLTQPLLHHPLPRRRIRPSKRTGSATEVPTANARRSRRCLPISKARPR